MICPKCQSMNPEEQNFCGDCGAKLARPCPDCGALNPAKYRFCGECGQTLVEASAPIPKELTFEEKLDKIRRYLPKDLTEKILSQRGKIEGERKQVTVMFCDLEGFTPLVEKIGADEAYAVMDQVYELLIHAVHDFEGTVNEMTGDGIMALFGAPIALEDAPQRAIRSALSVHREMARFNDKLRQENKNIPLLKMRIGIHSGPVVVGTLGNDLRVEFKAVGDTVNLAKRMEQLAESGSTYITDDTFKLTEGFFRYESLGEKKVKGKEKPIKSYRVIGPSTQRTRFDVSAEQGLTPFIGRERELELLLDGFERAKQGRGQAFSIIAEAGVGKSRLLYEFRKRIEAEDITFLEGKCLSYSRGMAYHPIIDLYRSNFDIQDDEAEHLKKEKIRKGLRQFNLDEASTLPYLLDLLSIKDSGIDKVSLTPQGQQYQLVETITRIPLKGSEIRPLIIAIEDLHWMDKSSEDALKYLMESIPGARILLIFTFRPEFILTWGGRSYHSHVNLNRLSNRETSAMAAFLLGTDEIDVALEDVILEKTEGVPFFIEEFIKSLKELGIVEQRDNRSYLAREIQDVIIPSTIQDIIMGRVDTLPEAAKEVLQMGSVIEREFSYEMIKRVAGLPQEELLSILSGLKDSELIYERGIYPHSTYIFKHALTREVVYDSLLTTKRKLLHLQVGQAMEKMAGENIEEYYANLIEHFIAGEDYEKGAEYARLATRKVAGSSQYEAILYSEKGVFCLEQLPLTEEVQRKIINTRTHLGVNWVNLTYSAAAKEVIDPIVDLAKQMDYKERLAQIHLIYGTYYYMTEENYAESIAHLEKARKFAEEVNDERTLYMARIWLGSVQSWNCEFDDARHNFNTNIDITAAANNVAGMIVNKSCLSNLYAYEGKVGLALQNSHDVIQAAEDLSDVVPKGMANICRGYSFQFKGSLEEAKKYLIKGSGLCEKGNFWGWVGMAQERLGMLCFDQGEYGESKEHFRSAAEADRKNGSYRSGINFNKTGALKAQVMMGDKDIEIQTLYGYITNCKVKNFQGIMRSFLAEILLNIDAQHMEEAEKWIQDAIETDSQNGMMWNVGRHHALYAEFFKRINDLPMAREQLNKAISIMNECCADGWVERYEKELVKIR